jgi:DNA-binding NarL/FixJ family response regulator
MTSVKNQIKILIADDHPVVRQGLRDAIKSDPTLELLPDASDGEQALRSIQELRPAIAILDIHMPGRSGLDIARALAARRLPVQVIMLTMYDDEEMFNEALSLGVKGYLLKDSAITEILSAIRAVAGGKTFISPSLSDHLLHRHDRSKALAKQKPGLDALSPTERHILQWIAQDRTTKEIAEVLGISARTVDTHRQNICHKLELHGTHSLLKFAYDHKSEL